PDMTGSEIIIILLAVIGAVLLKAAPWLSELLVRARSRRLPANLILRMQEEWLAELTAIPNRPSKLTFAISLILTRPNAFGAPSEDLMSEIHDHPRSFFAVLAGWKFLLITSTAIFTLAAYGMSFLLPVRYASEALIIAKPADVAADVVGMKTVPIDQQ